MPLANLTVQDISHCLKGFSCMTCASLRGNKHSLSYAEMLLEAAYTGTAKDEHGLPASVRNVLGASFSYLYECGSAAFRAACSLRCLFCHIVHWRALSAAACWCLRSQA